MKTNSASHLGTRKEREAIIEKMVFNGYLESDRITLTEKSKEILNKAKMKRCETKSSN